MGPRTAKPRTARIKGILFVPHTPWGELANALQKVEDSFSRVHDIARVKVVERGGRKILDMDTLSNKNPRALAKCTKEDCMLCLVKWWTKRTRTSQQLAQVSQWSIDLAVMNVLSEM